MVTTPVDARKLIQELDLDYPIEEARKQLGDRVKEAAQCYRDFLYVSWFAANRAPDGRVAVICDCADAVWHEHILVTSKYRADCETIFGPGVYLDHIPADYYGVEVTEADRDATIALYEAAGVQPCGQPRAECVWSTP